MTVTAANDVLHDLENLGTEQYRKIYKRHGVGDNLYGVSYANLQALAKKTKTDHRLAQDLWTSGNYDARVLAVMVADPESADDTLIESWADDLTSYPLTDALASFVAKIPLVRQKAEQWTRSPEEWRGSAGWQLVARLAMEDRDLPDTYFEDQLHTIERDIHSAPNRARYSMNTALIAIGLRSDALQQKAIATAEKIGQVHVDHGQTGCKTPEAKSYILKASARKK